MSNINLGQFLNNFTNNVNRIIAGNVQNNAVPNMPANTEQQTASLIKEFFPNTAVQLSQTAAELTALNQSQTVNMLKELLNMPKNLEQLISQLTVNDSSAAKSRLQMLSSELDLSGLSTLLQSGSKEAAVKLYQMIAEYNQLGVSLKSEQLGEITKLISFAGASSTSDAQSLRTALLMYLPWLPLTDPNAFKLEIAQKGSDGGVDSTDSVTLLISTQNYGNMQCVLYKTQEDGIRIDVMLSETFPQKELSILMREESKKYGININLGYEVKTNFNKKKNEQAKTQVCMNVSSGVNPFLILISGSFIKSVHLVDEKENLKEQRKEKL